MSKLTVIGKSDDAKLLAEYLGATMNDFTADVGIRYGSMRMGHFKKMFNTDRAVCTSSDKYSSLELFKRAGLPVPMASINPNDLQYPMLGRRFFHSQGKDIVAFKSRNEYFSIFPHKYTSECDYYVQFIPVQHEYRVHVVCGEVVNIAVKVGGEKDVYCRNLKTGWTMKDSVGWMKKIPNLKEIAKKAVACLGLDFGAVDVLLGKDGKPYVLEVNTAPGLIERRADIYARIIRQHIR